MSDEDGKICEKYGTWIEKSLYGRKYMGIDRATFLIDKDGVVAKVWHKVKVEGPRRRGRRGTEGAVAPSSRRNKPKHPLAPPPR